MILRKNSPNAVRFHVNFSAREAKALFGRGFRWKKYRFSYRFARWRRDSGRERSKAVLGIQAVHTLGPGPGGQRAASDYAEHQSRFPADRTGFTNSVAALGTAKKPAKSSARTITQWASEALKTVASARPEPFSPGCERETHAVADGSNDWPPALETRTPRRFRHPEIHSLAVSGSESARVPQAMKPRVQLRPARTRPHTPRAPFRVPCRDNTGLDNPRPAASILNAGGIRPVLLFISAAVLSCLPAPGARCSDLF